ncbi:MAG: proline iminopeptidase [Oscillospiraceae bacterium]
MSTSDKELLRLAKRRWFIIAFCCAVFSLVYEWFGHGVLSAFMLFQFAFPLLLGALAAAVLLRWKAAPCPDFAVRWLWRCGVGTLTLGSCLAGVFEIYGASAPLITVHWCLGGALCLAAALRYFLPLLRRTAAVQGAQTDHIKEEASMTVREGYMPFEGHETYYRIVGERRGDKAPLILLHGGPGSTHNYFEVLDELAREDGRELIMYDQIGCGKSYLEGRPELWCAETWVRELQALREHLGLTECHLLGQSWGGMLLLDYVCNYHPEGVKSIILSSTLPSSRLWGEEQHRMIAELPQEMQEAIRRADESGEYSGEAYQAAEAEFMLRHAAGPVTEDSPECVRRERRTGEESYVVGWGPNEFTPLGTLKDFDVTDKLGDIKQSALVISGGNDLCTPYIAKVMYDGIPDARWELFRTCRHACFVEDTPRYTALLREWLNAHD